MAVLTVPELDLSYPTLGPAIVDFIEDRCVFGPGSLEEQRAVIDAETRGLIYRLYEVFPQGHRLAGRRRFKRGALELRKGLAKTEKAAWITFCELHPEGPVRCDGFDANGNPVGRPVKSPYIPMMAVTEEQVSELAYGVLKYVVEHSPDADLFDASLERIIRYGHDGGKAGEAVPVSGAPGSRDGARTTFQHFDEPHRLFLPRVRQAHETMLQNMNKRPLEEPWTLYTSTAGQPGQNSIQEDVRREAEKVDEGKKSAPRFFFFSRWAGPEHDDLSTMEKRIAAVTDATGPGGEWGPGQFEDIAADYDREGVDRAYWERVWLNRWRKSGSQAFNMPKVLKLACPGLLISPGAFVTVGFDGARFRDATGLVITEIYTGRQQLVGGWERPVDQYDADGQLLPWEVPEAEVTAVLEQTMERFEVWRGYFDPPHWTETVANWSTRWPDQIVEWWTNQYRKMAYAVRAYNEAFDSGSIEICGTETADNVEGTTDSFLRHLGNSGRKDLNIVDDEGKPLFVMQKMDGRSEDKFDFAMSGCLSWTAALDARRSGAQPRPKVSAPRRIR